MPMRVWRFEGGSGVEGSLAGFGKVPGWILGSPWPDFWGSMAGFGRVLGRIWGGPWPDLGGGLGRLWGHHIVGYLGFDLALLASALFSAFPTRSETRRAVAWVITGLIVSLGVLHVLGIAGGFFAVMRVGGTMP